MYIRLRPYLFCLYGAAFLNLFWWVGGGDIPHERGAVALLWFYLTSSCSACGYVVHKFTKKE